jgi:hypothetical protein
VRQGTKAQNRKKHFVLFTILRFRQTDVNKDAGWYGIENNRDFMTTFARDF